MLPLLKNIAVNPSINIPFFQFNKTTYLIMLSVLFRHRSIRSSGLSRLLSSASSANEDREQSPRSNTEKKITTIYIKLLQIDVYLFANGIHNKNNPEVNIYSKKYPKALNEYDWHSRRSRKIKRKENAGKHPREYRKKGAAQLAPLEGHRKADI